jgi:hypothetical protein
VKANARRSEAFYPRWLPGENLMVVTRKWHDANPARIHWRNRATGGSADHDCSDH